MLNITEDNFTEEKNENNKSQNLEENIQENKQLLKRKRNNCSSKVKFLLIHQIQDKINPCISDVIHTNNYNFENNISEFSGIKNSKRRSKKNQLKYIVPVRVFNNFIINQAVFKSVEFLTQIIDKIITTFDPFQILRVFREKLNENPEFNNFKTRRVIYLNNIH